MLPALAAAIAAGWGCARPSAPPGAAEESEPPAIESLVPARDTVVAELGGPAKVRFDEPIQSRSGLGRQMVASPAYQYDVSVGHSEISVRPQGGWRPGAVYVLQFPAGITDLLNNSRKDPIRMVFSTGPPIRPTLVRMRLFDRITGQEQRQGRVLFVPAARDTGEGAAEVGEDTVRARPAPDTAGFVPYTAVADSTGRYVLRHLPPGDYWAFGFVDRNRSLRLDRRLEPYDSTRIQLASDTARASGALFLLEPDSTPPGVVGIETPDSVTVRLTFDDHLRPGSRPRDLRIRPERGGEELPVREVRVLEAEGAGRGAGRGGDSARPGPADTLPGDTLPEDTLARDTLPGDTLPEDTLPGQGADVSDADSVAPAAPPPSAAAAEAIRSDTLPADSASSDSAAVEAIRSDTLPADSASSDSAAAEAIRSDALPADSASSDSAAIEAIRSDTLPADSASSDSAAAADTTDVEKPPKPTRLVEVRLGRSLSPDTFRVRLRGVSNMWGLEGDVDTTFAYVPPSDTTTDAARVEAAGDTTTADTVGGAAPPDSAPRPDSTVVDSAASPPDSLLPDSAGADTSRADTAAADSVAGLPPHDSTSAFDSLAADTAAAPPDSLPPDSAPRRR